MEILYVCSPYIASTNTNVQYNIVANWTVIDSRKMPNNGREEKGDLKASFTQ